MTVDKDFRKADLKYPSEFSELLPQEFQDTPIPAHWQPLDFEVDGQKVLCIHMPAENPKAVLGFGHGFNSSPMDFEKKIRALNISTKGVTRDSIFKTLNDQGISVIATAFPNTKPGDKNFVENFRRINQEFMFNENSPLFTAIDPSLPRRALVHSACGLVALENLNNPENAAVADKLYEKIYVMNPMLGITNVTNVPVISSIFDAIAAKLPDEVPCNTRIGKSYMDLFNIKAAPDLPTFSQIIEMGERAQQYRHSLNNVEDRSNLMPSEKLTFILGKDDSCTSPKIGAHIARALGAEIKHSNGDHTPLVSDESALTFLANDITGTAPEINQAPHNESDLQRQFNFRQLLPRLEAPRKLFEFFRTPLSTNP